MSNYVLSVDEGIISGKILIDYLVSLSKTSDYVDILPQNNHQKIVTETLSDEEMDLVEMSLKSGICKDVSPLRKYIKSQI